MSVFPTAAHLASWAAVVPGCNESAAGLKSATTRPGNRHLKAALGVAALSAARSKDTYYNARYRRIAGTHRPATSHRRKARSPSVPALIAVVAVEHSMLIDAWNMVVNGAFYHDPAPTTPPDTTLANQSKSHQTTAGPWLHSHSRTPHPRRQPPGPATHR
ncbi:transposase IS116/IS110/IS902 family protein, partial [Mycobacterium kansasii 732]